MSNKYAGIMPKTERTSVNIETQETGFDWNRLNTALRFLSAVKPWWSAYSQRAKFVPISVQSDEGRPYGAITAIDKDMVVYIDTSFVRNASLEEIAGAVEREFRLHTHSVWNRLRDLDEEEWEKWANICFDMEVSSAIREEARLLMEPPEAVEGLGKVALRTFLAGHGFVVPKDEDPKIPSSFDLRLSAMRGVFSPEEADELGITGPPIPPEGWEPTDYGMPAGKSAEEYLEIIRSSEDDTDEDDSDDGDDENEEAPEEDQEEEQDQSPDDDESDGDSGDDEENEEVEDGSDESETDEDQEGSSEEQSDEEDDSEESDGEEDDAEESGGGDNDSEDESDDLDDEDSDEDSEGESGDGSERAQNDEDEESDAESDPDAESAAEDGSEGDSDESDEESGEDERESKEEGDRSDSEEESGEGFNESNSEESDNSEDDESELEDESDGQDEGEESEGETDGGSVAEKIEADRNADELKDWIAQSLENEEDPLGHQYWKPDRDDDEFEETSEQERDDALDDFQDKFDTFSRTAEFSSSDADSENVSAERKRNRRTDWATRLNQMVRNKTSQVETGGLSDISYLRRNPNQAMIGPILPGMIEHKSVTYGLLDVSFSMRRMFADAVNVFADISEQVFMDAGIEPTWFMGDEKIISVGDFSDWNHIKANAFNKDMFKGGTNFIEIMQDICDGKVVFDGKQYPAPDILVVLTDMQMHFPEHRISSGNTEFIFASVLPYVDEEKNESYGMGVSALRTVNRFIPKWLDLNSDFVFVGEPL